MAAIEESTVGRTGRIVTIGPEDTIAAAAQLMREHKLGSLVVVNKSDAIVGIITERDIVNGSTALCEDPEQMRVSEVMTAAPVSCSSATPVSKAHQVMVAYEIRHLPIVEDGKPVGMISSRDVLVHQLQVNKAMKAAAEQVALMGKSFKSLDLDEVLGVVASEVPRIFGADRCVLYFLDTQAEVANPLIRGRDCPWCERGLSWREDIAQQLIDSEAVSSGLPPVCQKLGCEGPKVLIRLNGSGLAKNGGRLHARQQSFLCMCGLPPATAASEELLQYKSSLVGDLLSVCLGNAKLYREVRRSSLIDPLTGLGTRRALEEKLAVEHRRAARYQRSFCVVMVDVDNFKAVNDRHGHAVGDRALGSLAEIFLANTRATDVTARYGGDEFVVMMPETKLEEAVAAAERLRRRVYEVLSMPDGEHVTISCGVAEWSGSGDNSPEDLLRKADFALYEAKRSGRNRVATATAAAAADQPA